MLPPRPGRLDMQRGVSFLAPWGLLFGFLTVVATVRTLLGGVMKRLLVALVTTATMCAGTVAGAQPASAADSCAPAGWTDGYQTTQRCQQPRADISWRVKVYCPSDPGYRYSAWRSSFDTIIMRCHGIRLMGFEYR